MPESVSPLSQVRQGDTKQTIDQMVDQIMSMPERDQNPAAGPVVRGRKGEHVRCWTRPERAVT